MKFIFQNKKNIVFFLIIILTILIRIPYISNEQGIDTFRTHYLSNYLIRDKYANWNLTPLSVLGLFPYSYPIGIMYLISLISVLTTISISSIILILNLLLGVFGALGIYILSKEIFYNQSFNEEISLVSMFLFSISPLFLNFTYWNMSTRAPFVVVNIYLIYVLLKSYRTKNSKFILLSVILLIISATIHRMFLYNILLVLPPFFISLILVKLNLKVNKKIFFYSFIILFLILFLLQFSKLDIFFYQKYTYRTGFFFNAGTIEDYKNNNLNNFYLFLNLIIDYISNTGIIFLFFIFGIFLLLFFNDDFLKYFFYFLFLFSAPFYTNGFYTSFFLLPFFIIVGTYCLFYIKTNLNKIFFIKFKKLFYFFIFFLLIFSLLFSIFMNYHWLKNFNEKNEKSWITKNTIFLSNFIINEIDKNISLYTSNFILNGRLRGYINNSILTGSEKEDLMIFSHSSPNEVLKLKFSFYYLLTPRKGLFDINYTEINPRKDWEYILKKNQKYDDLIKFYNIKYAVESENKYYVSPKWKFYIDLPYNENKIYHNKEHEFWKLVN